ncbi:hypothetical protein BBK36DRAFT_1168116 [Trichoderma citrinoviride]|uniref:ATPase AAA-type core domain-containing protein n=1 Tax=Trichoderma citrinoviride TaxID=58853 RepID=A0A2T4BEH8_9HYPO|nr:hypothetical protein BBK36DRAFT_1168116 [Trichoderma citrinoviride]PTB67740.1 hypothetical protein BBK36DRAFT_1168116 [Trichoderma citrinoviride]
MSLATLCNHSLCWGDLLQNKQHMELREDGLCFQKHLVLSLSQDHNTHQTISQASSSSSTAVLTTNGRPVPMGDVIIGKGQGLIILLSGAPGNGKTLAAEAVADRTHRPLSTCRPKISASTRRPSARTSSECSRWRRHGTSLPCWAKLSVFRVARNSKDIHRNEPVSIFLRELEYFPGIIFLATHLYHISEAAFLSRARDIVRRTFLQRLLEQDGLDVSPRGRDTETDAKTLAPLEDAEIGQLSL